MEKDKTKIEELSHWDMANTVSINTEYHERKSIPEATAKNMEILMDKINELVQEVNRLKQQL